MSVLNASSKPLQSLFTPTHHCWSIAKHHDVGSCEAETAAIGRWADAISLRGLSKVPSSPHDGWYDGGGIGSGSCDDARATRGAGTAGRLKEAV